MIAIGNVLRKNHNGTAVEPQPGSKSVMTAEACSKQIREAIDENVLLYKSVTGLKYKSIYCSMVLNTLQLFKFCYVTIF